MHLFHKTLKQQHSFAFFSQASLNSLHILKALSFQLTVNWKQEALLSQRDHAAPNIF